MESLLFDHFSNCGVQLAFTAPRKRFIWEPSRCLLPGKNLHKEINQPLEAQSLRILLSLWAEETEGNRWWVDDKGCPWQLRKRNRDVWLTTTTITTISERTSLNTVSLSQAFSGQLLLPPDEQGLTIGWDCPPGQKRWEEWPQCNTGVSFLRAVIFFYAR